MSITAHFEVVIIGAGPAGLGAATNAASHKIPHLLIERREIGNTIFDYQLGKLVMAEPTRLPLRGHVPFTAGSREEILGGWQSAVQKMAVNTVRGEVSKIKKLDARFEIHGTNGIVTAKNVVLAIGVQGTPRRLGVPGDDQDHVYYTLSDPKALNDKDVLVVGAGDAAIENALALCDQNRVALLNRSAEFPRAKEANVAKVMEAIRKGKLKLLANAATVRVEPTTAVITTSDGEIVLPCNHIIARLGGILPRKFLESCGIKFPSEDPSAVPVVNSRYESNVPGLYLLGALIGYPLIKHAMNQGFEVIEHILGKEVEPADQVLVAEVLKTLPGGVSENLNSIRESLPFFKDLSDPQFRELIIDSKVHRMSKGDVVFERNDYTDTFFSIVRGSVAIDIGGGKSVTLNKGQFFGEMGLLSGRRRAATVRTNEEGSIFVESPRKQILKLNNSVASIKRALDQIFVLRALSTSLFPGVDPSLLSPVIEKATFKAFKKGELLCTEGEIGDAAYFVRKGSLKISRKDARGINVTQTYVPAGNLVGEMALLPGSDGKRSATVSAAVGCETIIIKKEDLLSLVESSPLVRSKLETIVAARRVENITQEQDIEHGALLDFMVAQGVTDADNFLLIDSDLCVACDNCENACAATHKGYSRLDRKGGQNFASVQIPISCRHCENPLCMIDCPPDALTRQSNGEVVIRDSCIGCGNCVRNCPYGVIQLVYDTKEDFSLLSMLGFKKKEKGPAKAAKCDMCSSLEGGPACVRSCPTGAAMRVNPKRMLEILETKRSLDHA